MMPPNLAPTPRDPAAVLTDLRRAVDGLKTLIHRQERWGTSGSLCADLDALADGIRRSAVDLRVYLGGAR